MNKKVLIVGGVAAGASTAARLRRLDEQAEIIMFERGEDISFANCGLPYYIGGTIEKRKSLLVQTPKSMHSRFNIDVRTMSNVEKIFPADKEIQVRSLLNNEIYREKYDYLVLCPGASPVVPQIPGIEKANVFWVRNVPDSDRVKQHIAEYRPAAAVIIGGGAIGLEMAEVLAGCQVSATIVEANDQVMDPLDPEMAAILQSHLKKMHINLCLSDRVVALEGSSQVSNVKLESGKSVPADMVIIGMGVRPENILAREAGLNIGPSGGIVVDEYLRTSDPNIYAAGDAIEIKNIISGESAVVPLAGPANRQGWVVANNIAGREVKYRGSQGTAIVKVADTAAAVTGKNEKSLKKLGYNYLTCHIHPSSHATYYPGSNQMCIKLLFTPQEGKILGAQIVGQKGVDKRIDVLATAIKAGMTVFDLQELELAYAPPFSSAKDPVNLIGYAAANIIKHDIEVIQWGEVPEHMAKGALLLDVRTSAELKGGKVDGAFNISVDQIRERIEEIPRDKEILAYCEVGLRSYIANRILRQMGYNVKNISGGYRLYSFLAGK
ncbi:MAG TPA: CoA-disulfide reductase [Syntrophomonas sp.]|jgi:NADPH-dependent 2,4-dienoyl-CoA reductase/sulfur reductase-like enzyme/rhodanese-related sulfurtransferase|nr:CoA-disulfide reductase [Syntrophomonas sp.]